MLPQKLPGQPGRPRKYGNRLGTCAEMAATFKAQASKLRVFLYGDYRDVMIYSTVVMLKTLKCPVRVVWFAKPNGLHYFPLTWICQVKEEVPHENLRKKKILSDFFEVEKRY